MKVCLCIQSVSLWFCSFTGYFFVLLVSQPLEDLHHGVGDGVDHLVVVVVEGHFNIQTHKLSQVPVGVGVFCPEN